MPTLGELRRLAARRLAEAGLPTPDLDARWLVAAALGIETQAILLSAGTVVGQSDVARIDAVVARRLAGEPVDRILGERDFWGLSFALASATLSPRPDTEAIVAAALAAKPEAFAPLRVLDLGTGSGAILVALLVERPAAFGVGLDRSREAASLARANAARNGVGGRAAFVVGNWTDALGGRFDLILSNPPYIASADLLGLDREVREHDPALALDGGADGLDAYRAIMPATSRLLADGGVAIFELGFGQETAVAAIAGAAGLVADGPARRDLGGVPRALVLRC